MARIMVGLESMGDAHQQMIALVSEIIDNVFHLKTGNAAAFEEWQDIVAQMAATDGTTPMEQFALSLSNMWEMLTGGMGEVHRGFSDAHTQNKQLVQSARFN
ncbi:hypothetical protein AB0M54_14880 [Actinoplanes sp. NPDC051470]|uniref:hypothetical protein n=1 Tax=Actinoplanes sp. NPDC051470 TaxID=3157224 RepID=UPI003427AC4E